MLCKTEDFWFAEPLNILIQTVLTKALSLEDAEVDVANGQVLQYLELLSKSKTLEEAWQQRSFYELMVDIVKAKKTLPNPATTSSWASSDPIATCHPPRLISKAIFQRLSSRSIFRQYLSRLCPFRTDSDPAIR